MYKYDFLGISKDYNGFTISGIATYDCFHRYGGNIYEVGDKGELSHSGADMIENR